MRWPTQRAGSRNTGSRASATRVICQDRRNIATRVMTTLDDVADHRREGVGERLLRVQHVVVEPADQRAGLGPGEEGDRHPLEVGEHLGPHVEDQALRRSGPRSSAATATGRRRRPPGPTSRTASSTIRLESCWQDAVVDDRPVDERVGRAEQGVDDDQRQEDGEHPPVRRGEPGDAPEDARREPLGAHGLVAAERAHQAPAAARAPAHAAPHAHQTPPAMPPASASRDVTRTSARRPLVSIIAPAAAAAPRRPARDIRSLTSMEVR